MVQPHGAPAGSRTSKGRSCGNEPGPVWRRVSVPDKPRSGGRRNARSTPQPRLRQLPNSPRSTFSEAVGVSAQQCFWYDSPVTDDEVGGRKAERGWSPDSTRTTSGTIPSDGRRRAGRAAVVGSGTVVEAFRRFRGSAVRSAGAVVSQSARSLAGRNSSVLNGRNCVSPGRSTLSIR